MPVVFAVSKNDHISFATFQFCCEKLHLNTFFYEFLKSLLFEVELKKRDQIDHGPGCFKAVSNRECLILSVAVCIARRLCNQACELNI